VEEEMMEQQVTLNDYLRVLYRGRWIILISFLVVVASTVYFTFTAQPVYEASALVMLKEEGTVRRQIFEVSSYMKRETMINNQVEVLKSRTLGMEVIRRLQESPHADSLSILGNPLKNQKFSLTKWVFSIFRGEDSNVQQPSFDDLVDRFRAGTVTVAPKRDTDMIELKAQAYSPFEASFVANTWMESYRDLDISESREEVSEVREFLEDKLKDVQDAMSASEEALKDYKETQKVAELTTETEQLIKQLADFETTYQEAKTDLEANEKRLAHLKDQLSESQKALVEKATSLSSPVIKELERQLATMIARKAALDQQVKGAGLSSEFGNVNELDQRILGIQEKIIEETRKMVAGGGAAINPLGFSETIFNNILQIETENKSLTAKTEALGKIVDQYNRELNSLPEKSLRLVRLRRETAVNNNIYMMLREKYEENRIAEAGQIGSVRVVDHAKPPKYPIKPKKKMNLILGIMVGLGLGVGLTFLREYLDTSLKSMEDVERLGYPVLGSIPYISVQRVAKHARDQNGDIKRIEARLITHFAPKSPISEAYRTLRTNIQFTHIDRPIKTVLVTSSGPGEGKSTSVANLAIAFAQMGTNALLVDTDLRRPVLHAIFDQPRDVGLTNVLVGKVPFEEAVRPTKIDNLHLLTSGTLPPNPSELLGSEAMMAFLRDAKEKYDIVLFDSPPVIAVTDAAILGTRLDGIVLVAKSGSTGKDAIIRSRILLENVNAHIFGILVNGVNIEHMYGSYYYYYIHYYYGDGKHKKKLKAPKSIV
jgi:capsular exopolysaccharide synthesis family protein